MNNFKTLKKTLLVFTLLYFAISANAQQPNILLIISDDKEKSYNDDEFILSQIEAIEESPKSDVTTKIMAKTFKKAYQPDEADIVDSGSVENWGFAVLDGRAKLSNVPAEIRTKVNDFAQTKVQKGYVPENPVLTELQQTKSAKMLKDFNGIANTIGIFDVKQGMDTLNAIYGGDGIEKASGLTDIAAVNAFQRMIDPGATVREGDVDLIESAVPVFARFAPGFQWKKLKEGLKMPPEMRKKMLEEATKVYNKKAQEFDKGVGNKFMLQAEQAGIPFYLVGEKFYDEDQAGYQEFLRENFGDDWQEYDSSANKVIWEKEQGGELKEVIGQAESGGNYNAIYGNATQSDIDFSKKTMAEILQIQKDHVASGQPSSAIGKYQFIQGTLKGLINELGMTGQELFTPEVQDKMFQQLLLRRGYNQYKAGEITLEQFQENLAKEWASLPKDKTGLSYYEGDGLNKALITPEQLQSSITG